MQLIRQLARNPVDLGDPSKDAYLRPHYPTPPQPPVAYVPNLIGYVRVVLSVWAATLATSKASTMAFVYAYVASYALDAFDGLAARLLGQQSKIGAALDMVTDRCVGAPCLSRPLSGAARAART